MTAIQKAPTYRLGVDLGTTYTAAAVARDGRYRVVRLGQNRADIPSTVCLGPEDVVLVGDAAEAVGHERPTAVARQCKRRLGDLVPIILDGRPFSPQSLMAHTLRWTVDTVTKAQGGTPPELLTVTCPANWGPYKHDLLAEVIRLADVPSAIICTEPEAAAFHHADEAALSEGSMIAVYDHGGGTFDAAVLCVSASGAFVLKGPPEGIEHHGGDDYSEAVFRQVLQVVGSHADELAASTDPAAMAALATLKRRCVVAKELLSTEPAASIEVSLPGLETTVRITRPEFEAMIRPALGYTMEAFGRALRNAKINSDDLSAVVLVGGSVRIPLISETVSRSVSCPVVMPVDPGHSVALGAAMAAARYRMPRHNNAPARTRPRPANAASPPPGRSRRPRESTVTAREVLKLGRGEQARLAGWLAKPGSTVAVGQPLGRVAVTGGGRARTALIRSPFEGVVHRYFAEPGAVVRPDHLLVSYRQVAAYLSRPGRSAPADAGVSVKINPPTTTTAFTGRPVIFVDRMPRTTWWSASLTILTEPGEHVVSAAYTRDNQWFGVASQVVQVPEAGLLELDYTEPGVGAAAVLRPGSHASTPSQPAAVAAAPPSR